jgi:hypothetical protein
LPIVRVAVITPTGAAATTAALTLSNNTNVQQQQQQQQNGAHSPKVVLPIVDYVIAAWRVRCSALAGRETNGGNAMV